MLLSWIYTVVFVAAQAAPCCPGGNCVKPLPILQVAMVAEDEPPVDFSFTGSQKSVAGVDGLRTYGPQEPVSVLPKTLALVEFYDHNTGPDSTLRPLLMDYFRDGLYVCRSECQGGVNRMLLGISDNPPAVAIFWRQRKLGECRGVPSAAKLKVLVNNAIFDVYADAHQHNQPMLLYFEAPWCGICKQVEPIIRRLELSGCPVRRINIDTEPKIKDDFHVLVVPATIVVARREDATDNELARHVGKVTEAQLRQDLKGKSDGR